MRAYATEQVNHTETEEQRDAATHRLLDHYLHTAHIAVRLVDSTSQPVVLSPPQPGVTLDPPVDRRGALAWFDAEKAVLMAAVAAAADAGFDTHSWQLAWDLFHYLYVRGLWHDQASIGRIGVVAATRLADPRTLAEALRLRACADTSLGRLRQAHDHLQHALELFDRIGDLLGQASAHIDIGWVLEKQGRQANALEHVQRALDLFRATGDPSGQAWALSALGGLHAQRGARHMALVLSRQALALTKSSTITRARPKPGATSATPTITSATTRELSPVSGVRSSCTETWATATAKPPPCPRWATRWTPPATPTPLVAAGRRRWPSSRTWVTPMPNRCVRSSVVPQLADRRLRVSRGRRDTGADSAASHIDSRRGGAVMAPCGP